jgi:hypothetical protein
MKSRFVVSVLAIGLVTVAPAIAYAAPTKDDPDALSVRGVDRYKHGGQPVQPPRSRRRLRSRGGGAARRRRAALHLLAANDVDGRL